MPRRRTSDTPAHPLIGVLTIQLHLATCASLKEKRGHLKPLLYRLRREFNLSVAEIGFQDHWQQALISCAMVGNEPTFLRSALHTVEKWVSANWPDGMIADARIELV